MRGNIRKLSPGRSLTQEGYTMTGQDVLSVEIQSM